MLRVAAGHATLLDQGPQHSALTGPAQTSRTSEQDEAFYVPDVRLQVLQLRMKEAEDNRDIAVSKHSRQQLQARYIRSWCHTSFTKHGSAMMNLSSAQQHTAAIRDALSW